MNEIYILLQLVFIFLNGLACIILSTFIIVNVNYLSDDDWVQIYNILGSDQLKKLTLGNVILGYIISVLKKVSSCLKMLKKCSCHENCKSCLVSNNNEPALASQFLKKKYCNGSN